ncbi:MAG: plasmid partitioning protein RepB [Paracoccaceae bacterium]
MTDKKKRMSMLDNLAAASPPPATSMMTTNRALRSARDAVDGHNIWDLDPASISDSRVRDRLRHEDVADLRDSIEQNGQTVPIMVRRDPKHSDRYLLVYGRRRLEAIRISDKVTKIKAIVASLGDDEATRAQISENMARRDLSYIEKGLFARELIDAGFGNQSEVAEVLTVTKSSVSMALTIVDLVSVDLIRSIGPAHGVGRPKWEALGKAIEENGLSHDRLASVADKVYTEADMAVVLDDHVSDPSSLSVDAFVAVMAEVDRQTQKKASKPPARSSKSKSHTLSLGGAKSGSVRRTASGVQIELNDGAFADWVETQAQDLIQELHDRWVTQSNP